MSRTDTDTDAPPLKYMGTQSRETVALEAALAQGARSTVEGADHLVGVASADAAALGRQGSAVAAKIDEVAERAVGKAKAALRSAAGQARRRATRAVEDYTRDDPTRAILIAAGVGALAMGVLAMLARSGARRVGRGARRAERALQGRR